MQRRKKNKLILSSPAREGEERLGRRERDAWRRYPRYFDQNCDDGLTVGELWTLGTYQIRDPRDRQGLKCLSNFHPGTGQFLSPGEILVYVGRVPMNCHTGEHELVTVNMHAWMTNQGIIIVPDNIKQAKLTRVDLEKSVESS